MLRRSMLLGLGLTVMGGLLTLPSFAPVHGNPGMHSYGSPVGTYLATFSVGTSKLLGVLTINADGTWTSSDLTDFGGITGFEHKQSPFRGIWKMVGTRKMQVTGLCFSFDAKTGAPKLVNRIFGMAEFAKGFKTAAGLTSQRYYFPLLQDPLDRTAGTPYPAPLNALAISLSKLQINK